MKFIYADSLDYVDPRYDFINDNYGEGRKPYWDDVYPHEILGYAPYDGILVSRATVGDHIATGKYTQAQGMRFRREGARKFLRFNGTQNKDKLVFGDCGSFSYAKAAKPPYTPEDTVEFYSDGGFTHGCSIDHIIFEFDESVKGMEGGSEVSKERFELTLELAEKFLLESKSLPNFTPVGVIQGWSPDSLAESARRLEKMGYDYLAIGGLVPLKIHQIHATVNAVHNAISGNIRLHLLGFGKADNLHEFTRYPQVASFDTTSPLLRAFKDNRKNYYLPNGSNSLDYYTAIRIPQAMENNHLKRLVCSGKYKQEHLIQMEQKALKLLREYNLGKADLNTTLEAIIEFSYPLHWKPTVSKEALEKRIITLRGYYEKTLTDRPWNNCSCPICSEISVETIIFRGSNRNKRRGIHNLAVFYKHLKDTHVI